MHILSGLLITILVLEVNISAEKFDLDTLNNYSEFLNFGDKKFNKIKRDRLENSIIKSKIDVLGEVFKKNIDSIKLSSQLDIVFLIDASSSVGEYNFKSELKFVKKLLSDVTVDYNHTRVAIVTFSSPSNIVKNVDEISNTTKEQNKCHLLNRQLNNITYKGGDTFTLGAFKAAKEIFSASNRNDSKKVLFLITDGYSNGGDPRELAEELKNERITIFTIGIRNGNYKELYDISSSPGQFYSYLLDSYNEFESLARRALHVDLKTGDYIPLGFNRPCDILCETGDCCDKDALCTCGTTTGHYSCVCQPGYYGTGLKGSCIPCPPRMYSEGPNLCLPCPSPLHITVPPASGIESCKCRSGYTKTSNNGCKELKCPTLGVPDHAYFVKKRDCVNVINSACGIRCEVGYILNGTSIRLCQENATWSGIDPVCEVKTCDRPPTPKDGTMKCFNPDLDQIYDHTEDKLPVDTVCGFKCTKGKFLSGSKQRTCIPLAKWDGLRTICKPIKCKKLPQLKYGKVEPPSCNYGKQEHGKKCKITCQKGFKITGNAEKVCGGPRGTWSGRFEETTCVDTTPPELHCPADITITTLPGRGYGQTNISEPFVVDNSDLNVTIWTKPAITNLAEFKFAIGTTNVTYFAQDAFQNVAKCSFQVTVKDAEAPIIENCENPPTFLISDSKGANITWDEPNIFDNSQKVNISKSHDFGFFRIGTTTVSYIATDPSGNSQTCFMNITLEDSRCESLPDPSNGHSDCMTKDDGIQCLITCQDGYAIPISQFDNEDNGINFVCKHADPIWYSHDGFSNPECTITQVPEETVQYGEIEINNTDICNSTEKLNEIENDLRSFINTEICDTNCTIETKPECDLEAMEEASNKILTKRQSEFEAIPHKNRNKKRKKFNIKFQVRGKYINTTSSASGGVVLPNGYAGTIRYDKMVFICPTGFVPRKNRCVQCPKGSYHNKTRNKCHSCPFGFYNNKLGQTECSPCPENHSTRKMHSKKAEDCKAKCPPGTYARRKILKYSKHQPNRTIETTTLMPHCRSCGYGSYQPSYGKTSCLQCPPGYTTNIVRAKNVEDCVPTAKEICKKEGVCNNGTCEALNNYYYSCNCLKNYIGSHCETLISECDSNPCLNGGTCSLSSEKFICTCKNGFTGKFCEETVEECKYNCLNNGTCVTLDDNEYACICPPGFGGDLCETKLSHCNAQLCQHNGTCEEDEGTFKCHCKNGYIGRRCHLLPCDYKPCKSYEVCENLETDNTTRDSYKCSCPDGFYGENCDEPFDPCENITCLNGGTCIQDKEKASCICTSLYYGPNCDLVRNSRYYLNFSRYDTNDYIRLPGFQKDLTEITACLWMQTLDNFNYGTLISYATKDKDNAFTITDYTGLVLYINNNYIVTDILLNDGQWHHLCVIWKSLNGSYDIFVGGILKKNGTDLSKGSKIEGNGNMIIGQEQDVLGGMFSQSESFMGKMAYIDIWSRELSPVEILKHLNDCNETFMGDLYPWPEMQDNVKGGVEVLNSSFCLKCEEPKPLYNGFIEIVENVAHYSCYKGFELNNDKYAKGRKCTKASKWEGNYEPFCKRVYCGYPGYIRNGYPLGTKYYYQDRIVFRCYDGYNLIGNSTIQCREDRQWFPEKPRCTGVQCSAFKQPSHSTMKILSDSSYEDYKENVTKFEPGTQIEVNCDEDATLIGDNFLTCLENGTWDLPPPKCDVKEETRTPKLNCDIAKVPRAPENGYVDIDSLFKAGNATTDYIIYKCRNGYRSLGENKSTCIIDGYWTQPNITCNLVTCDKPNLPKNMNIGPDNSLSKVFQFGNTTSFVCNEGYIMIGNNKIRCLMNGKWSRMLGKCIKKSCKRPNVKSQTTISGKSYLFEEVVKITCPSKKSYTLKCNKDGIWEGKKDSTC